MSKENQYLSVKGADVKQNVFMNTLKFCAILMILCFSCETIIAQGRGIRQIRQSTTTIDLGEEKSYTSTTNPDGSQEVTINMNHWYLPSTMQNDFKVKVSGTIPAPKTEPTPTAPETEPKPVTTPTALKTEPKPVTTPTALKTEPKPVTTPTAPKTEPKPVTTPTVPKTEPKPVTTPTAPKAEPKPATTVVPPKTNCAEKKAKETEANKFLGETNNDYN